MYNLERKDFIKNAFATIAPFNSKTVFTPTMTRFFEKSMIFIRWFQKEVSSLQEFFEKFVWNKNITKAPLLAFLFNIMESSLQKKEL